MEEEYTATTGSGSGSISVHASGTRYWLDARVRAVGAMAGPERRGLPCRRHSPGAWVANIARAGDAEIINRSRQLSGIGTRAGRHWSPQPEARHGQALGVQEFGWLAHGTRSRADLKGRLSRALIMVAWAGTLSHAPTGGWCKRVGHCHPTFTQWSRGCHALSGLIMGARPVPRASPWAIMSRPIRGFRIRGRPCPRASPWAIISRPIRGFRTRFQL